VVRRWNLGCYSGWRFFDGYKENKRLKKLLADAELNKAILNEALSGWPEGRSDKIVGGCFPGGE